MNTIHNFINERKNDLIQIYIKERMARGDGIMTLTIPNVSSSNINCIYLEDGQMPPELLTDLQLKRNENTNDTIYFYLCSYDKEGGELLALKI